MAIRRATARLVLAISLMVGFAATARAEELSGTYYGVEDAVGASIEIRPDPEGYLGTFFDRMGNSQEFEADRKGDAAEAVLGMDGRTVLMQITPLPYGAEVTLLPFDEAGNLVVAAGRRLSFVRSGLILPQPGPDFVPPPRDAAGRIAPNGFLASYEFWDPTGVRNGYLSLPDRARTMIRLFPAVQLDVIWKLCLAPGADRALALALRGQGVTCSEAIDGVAAMQRSARFEAFKSEARAQRAALRMSVRCAEGYPESREDCDAAARDLARQAVALDTAATVLARYR